MERVVGGVAPDRCDRLMDPIAACFGQLSGALVRGAVRGEVERRFGGVPMSRLEIIGFETRLGSREPRVDYFLGFDRGRPAALVETADALARAASESDRPFWHGLVRFGRRWSPHDPLSREVEDLWLEFDAESAGAALPGVFLGQLAPSRDAFDQTDWSQRCFALIGEVSGYSLAPSIQREFRRCMAALPDAGVIASLGFFLGRPHPGVRLCVIGFDAAGLGAYLRRLGWRGDIDGVTMVLESLARTPGVLGPELGMLHLDVGEDLGSRIGVELVFESVQQMKRARLDSPLLQRLVEAGLCDPRKAEALAAWPGAHFAHTTPSAAAQLYVRRLNHAKLQFDTSGGVGAKAYFGARMHVPPFLAAASHCPPAREFGPSLASGATDKETP